MIYIMLYYILKMNKNISMNTMYEYMKIILILQITKKKKKKKKKKNKKKNK